MRTLTLLCCMLFSGMIWAQDCLQDWAHYRELTIDYTASGDSLFDGPVAIVVNTGQLLAEGKIKSDLGDLRLMDANCNPLPFYPDSVASSTENQIWTKLPVLPAGESATVRMYYGNPNAEPAWNGDDVFVFFDDFEQDSVNLDKWETIGGYSKLRTLNGNLEYSTARDSASNSRFKFVRSTMNFSDPVWLDFRIQQNNACEFGFSSTDSVLERYMLRYVLPGDSIKLLAILRDTLNNGSASVTDYPAIWIPRNKMQRIRLKASVNANNKFYFSEIHNFDNGQFNDTPFEFPWHDMSGFHFFLTSFSEGFTSRLDYIRAWYERSAEPVSTVGDEVNNPIFVSIDPETAISWNAFPNPTTGVLNIQLNAFQQIDQWQLFNMQGQMLKPWDGQERQLVLNSLEAGVYLLVAIKGGQAVGRKRIVLLPD